jgi:GntR family phosphonate transport system transcriptional regulator
MRTTWNTRDDEAAGGPAPGVSLWRQVSEALAKDIEAGRLVVDQRLPSSAELGKRFKVNRHTVLKAISHLQAEGLLRIERGRGSYAVVNPVEFHLGPQQWFEENLRENNLVPSRTIVSIEAVPASADVARALKIKADAPVLFVTMLGEADGLPVNYGYHYFPIERLPGIEEAFRAIGTGQSKNFSFSTIFKQVGVKSWQRKTIRIRGRAPSREEARQLKIAPSDVLLVTAVVSVDAKGKPVVYAKTGYGGSRTELAIDL